MNDIRSKVLKSALGGELLDNEAGALAAIMTAQMLVAGAFLLEEGDADDSLHVILDGKLEVVKRTGAGEEASLAILRGGDLAGELSFIDGERHTVGLRALCETQVLTLSRAEFEKLVNKQPELVYKVMRAVARSAHRIVHRMNTEFIELSNYIFKQHGRY
jgi:CRP/FNR family cyclic AMP-dependent transcriptional regulator